jgi:cytochrome c biogenesis protein CcmG, thiol:disulfide interchange protein DsbE
MAAPVRPARSRARWWWLARWSLARWSLALAWGAVVVGTCPVASADTPALALLRPLEIVGYPARTTPPPWSGGTADARQVSLAALQGRVVLLNFWASWCVECRPEMPVLERLHRELGRRGLAVVGVNAREGLGTVSRYAGELGLTFPLVLDPDGKIGALYGVVGLPATFLVGRDGRAVGFAIGPRPWGGAAARELLDALLAEPAPPPGKPALPPVRE